MSRSPLASPNNTSLHDFQALIHGYILSILFYFLVNSDQAVSYRSNGICNSEFSKGIITCLDGLVLFSTKELLLINFFSGR